MSEIKKHCLESIASEQMQITIKTSEETKTWRNKNKKKWKHEKIKNLQGSLKQKQKKTGNL